VKLHDIECGASTLRANCFINRNFTYPLSFAPKKFKEVDNHFYLGEPSSVFTVQLHATKEDWMTTQNSVHCPTTNDSRLGIL
jgi:hypothetical protein